jgi:predicted metalloprotease with PDZ domain
MPEESMIAYLLLPILALTPSADPYHYTLHVVSQNSRTTLAVDLRYRPEQKGPVTIELPRDYFGMQNLEKWVTVFEGRAGTVVQPGKTAREKLVTPGSDGTLTIRYELAYPLDPDVPTYGPVCNPDRLQMMGCQWLLRIGDLKAPHAFDVTFKDVPKGWPVYSSLAEKSQRMRFTKSYSDLIQSVLGTGDVFHRRFRVNGKPVDIYLGKRFRQKPDEKMQTIEKVVRMQRDWFKDYDYPFFTISLTEREGAVAGVRFENTFVCFVPEDVDPQALLVLLSHEMLHNWIPGRIGVVVPGEKNRWGWSWFDEGVNDYFARRLLMDGGMLSRDEFVTMINRLILNLVDDPYSSALPDEAAKAMDEGRFGNAFVKVAYYRGALMGLTWDAQIREKTGGRKSGADALKELYAEAKRSGWKLTPAQFYAVFSKLGVDAERDRERWVLKAEEIDPPASAFAPDYRLVQVEHSVFDLGFSSEETYANHKITGVVPGGPADRAGLKNGMEFVSSSNANRFANAYEFDKPAVIKVRVDGVEKVFSYMPAGKVRPVWQYVRR